MLESYQNLTVKNSMKQILGDIKAYNENFKLQQLSKFCLCCYVKCTGKLVRKRSFVTFYLKAVIILT